MTFEETVRATVDRAVAELQNRVGSELRMRADELVHAADAERRRAASDAAEAAAAKARTQAAAELAKIEERAATELETLRQVNRDEAAQWERKLSDLRQTIDSEIAAIRDRAEAGAAHAAALVESIRRMDGARSLAEILGALLDGAAGQLDRAVLLVVRDDRLRGWRAAGFRELTQPQSIDISVAEAGALGDLTRAATSIVLFAGQALDDQALPSFAEDVTARAVALPLIVGGVAVAVLYGETSDAEPTDIGRRAATLEILTRHAARALEVITMRQSIGLTVVPAVARGSHAVPPAPAEQSELRVSRGDRSFLGSV